MAAFMFTIIDCRNKRYAKYYMVCAAFHCCHHLLLCHAAPACVHDPVRRQVTMAISICWLGVLVWVMVSGLEKMSEMLGMSTVTVRPQSSRFQSQVGHPCSMSPSFGRAPDIPGFTDGLIGTGRLGVLGSGYKPSRFPVLADRCGNDRSSRALGESTRHGP